MEAVIDMIDRIATFADDTLYECFGVLQLPVTVIARSKYFFRHDSGPFLNAESCQTTFICNQNFERFF